MAAGQGAQRRAGAARSLCGGAGGIDHGATVGHGMEGHGVNLLANRREAADSYKFMVAVCACWISACGRFFEITPWSGAASRQRPRIPSDPWCRYASTGSARRGWAPADVEQAHQRALSSQGAASFRRTGATPMPAAAASHIRPTSLNCEPSLGSGQPAGGGEPGAPGLQRAAQRAGPPDPRGARTGHARAQGGRGQGVSMSRAISTCSMSA